MTENTQLDIGVYSGDNKDINGLIARSKVSEDIGGKSSLPCGQHVYFITDGAAIKIGFSNNPDRRCVDLQQSANSRLTLLAVTPGGWAEEQKLHAKFAHLRTHSEWFQPGPDLIQFIEGIMDAKKTGGITARQDLRWTRAKLTNERNALPPGAERERRTLLICNVEAAMRDPTDTALLKQMRINLANYEARKGIGVQ